MPESPLRWLAHGVMVTLLSLNVACASQAENRYHLSFVDAHLHYADFMPCHFFMTGNPNNQTCSTLARSIAEISASVPSLSCMKST